MAEPIQTVPLNSYRVRAGRFALQKLYGRKVTTPDGVAAMVPALQKRWRWYVNHLEAGKFRPMDKKSKKYYMLMCPPFGLAPAPGTDPLKVEAQQPCSHPLVCPFCYVRMYVFNAYDRVRAAMSWEKKNTRTLFATMRTYQADVDGDRVAAATRVVWGIVNGPARRTEFDAFSGLGGVVMHNLRPVVVKVPQQPDRKGNERPPLLRVTRLMLTRSALVVTEPSVKMPYLPDTQAIRVDNPTEKELSYHTGRLFNYGRGWFDVSPIDSVGFEAAMSSARVFSSYGTCRRKSGVDSNESGEDNGCHSEEGPAEVGVEE